MNNNGKSGTVRKVVVVGGGRAGEAILDLLHRDDRYAPFVLETDFDRLRTLQKAGIPGAQIDGSDVNQTRPFLSDAVAVICAAPASVAPLLARAANAEKCHFIDMCEDISVMEKVTAEARDPDLCFASGCGLAPGLVSALTDAMIRGGPGQGDLTAYVGVLPAERTNRLGYGNLWDIDGLMAEYTRPCGALQGGEVVKKLPLAELEQITVGETVYEAFTTSGSVEDLVRHYQGTVSGLVFKTLRYPGHLDYIRFLLDDLRLSDRLYMLRNVLLNGLPKVEHDKVIIHIVDRASTPPRTLTRLYDATALPDGHHRSSVSTVSAQHVCAVLDILAGGLAPRNGVLHHTDLTSEVLGQSRYADIF